jgi:hypothetical protein
MVLGVPTVLTIEKLCLIGSSPVVSRVAMPWRLSEVAFQSAVDFKRSSSRNTLALPREREDQNSRAGRVRWTTSLTSTPGRTPGSLISEWSMWPRKVGVESGLEGTSPS